MRTKRHRRLSTLHSKMLEYTHKEMFRSVSSKVKKITRKIVRRTSNLQLHNPTITITIEMQSVE